MQKEKQHTGSGGEALLPSTRESRKNRTCANWILVLAHISGIDCVSLRNSHAVVVLKDIPSGLDGTLEGRGVHDCPRSRKGMSDNFSSVTRPPPGILAIS
jgi:hypothetical protein